MQLLQPQPLTVITSIKLRLSQSIPIFLGLEIVTLYSDSSFEYYKVQVPPGTRLIEGSVSQTCESVGLKAVCSGHENCVYTDIHMCMVTSLSQDCGYPM